MRSLVLDRNGLGYNVKNLGWLLRNWRKVASFTVTIPKNLPDGWECMLTAHLNDGGIYRTPFASLNVLRGWIDRPVFRGLKIEWCDGTNIQH